MRQVLETGSKLALSLVEVSKNGTEFFIKELLLD